MGRIDEALRRAADSPATDAGRAALPLPVRDAKSAGEPFESPWAFEETDSGAEPVRRPAAEVARDVDASGVDAAPLALFRGFNPEVAPCLAVGPKSNSSIVEQFRRLAATLHHGQLVQGTKVLMVTSAMPGDGKSLTAANVALTLSESYKREVLLVDADLRRPSLHSIFQVPNVAGLNEGLLAAGSGKLSTISISPTLTLLPAGRPNPDPMGILTSARMAQVVREAAARFDWVILDTAPVGLLADANLIANMVDGALFVVAAGKTPHALVTKAVEAVGRDRIIGVVLNGVEGHAMLDASYYRAYTDQPASKD